MRQAHAPQDIGGLSKLDAVVTLDLDAIAPGILKIKERSRQHIDARSRQRFAQGVSVVYDNMVGYAGLPLLALVTVYALWLVFVGPLGTDYRGFVACCATLPLANLVLYSTVNVPTRRYMLIWLVVLAVGVYVHAADLIRAVVDRRRASSFV